MINGGPLRLFVLSCGVELDPMGVARLSFGGRFVGIASGGNADVSEIGGAAALLTALWCGDDGIASPSLGSLFAGCVRAPPGIGGRSSGAGDAMSNLSGCSTRSLAWPALLWSATVDK